MKGVLVFLCVAVAICFGYKISSCDNNNKLQVNEARPTILTCDGITHNRMVWKLRHTNGTESQIGTCTKSTPACSDTDSSYTLSRAQFSTSELIIRDNLRNKIAGTVTCAGLSGGSLMNATSCDVRVVYTDYRVTNCQTSVSTTTDWTVYGSCGVTKIFASDGKYNCDWTTWTHTTFPGEVGLTSFTASGKEYQKMTCPFTGKPLPSQDGTYNYTVTIDPAKYPNIGHVGKPLIIVSAKGPPVLHGCPDYVMEVEDAHCTCQASASEPPAVVTWSSGVKNVVSNTSTLTLSNVSRSLNGVNYTCKQYWGGLGTGHVKTAVYTLNVTYPPPSPPMIQGALNYTEGDSLHLACTVTGGNPPVADVALACGNHSQAEVTATYSRGEQRVKNITISNLDVSFHGSSCECSATWEERPNLYTSTSTVTIVVHRTTTLSVSSTSTPSSSSSSSSSSADAHNSGKGGNTGGEDNSLIPIAGGAAGAAVVIIIVIVIVVVICRRRRGDKKRSVEDRKKSIRAEHDYEFEEHINMAYESADGLHQPQTKPSAVALRIPAPAFPQTEGSEPDAVEDIDGGYTSVSSQAVRASVSDRANVTQQEQDDGLYSTADEPAAAAATAPSADLQTDPYSVVDDVVDNQSAGAANASLPPASSSGRRNAGAHAAALNPPQTQPDLQNNEYAVVNKPRKKTQQPAKFAPSGNGDENPGQDVYAQVNKKPKGGKPPSSELQEEETELGAHAQNPERGMNPTPAVKPKPAVTEKPPVPGKPRQSDIKKSRPVRPPLTDGYEDVDLKHEADPADIGTEDEYNTLQFHRPPPTEPPGNPEPTYSHIGAL